MLAYGVTADFMDEYLKIGEPTVIESLKKFVKAVISIFSEEYLRSPNNQDIARLLAEGKNRGFLGMLGSIDCMHWKWKNCPAAWAGRAPPWATFVKTISSPQGNKKKYFAAAQESARKDVECAFGVLQARFAIVRGPARFFHLETLKDIMTACVILHNMIIEDERNNNGAEDFEYEQFNEPLESVTPGPTNDFSEFIRRHHGIRDKETHSQLQLDLVEHLWQLHSEA
ncbi:hypothetical protein SLA2020_268430 [Shorea laevis]